mmetsp:Transcript_89218/g.257254  ORF Transcript_89218/g.257254 Transcript_89218/m.257254 type:complete len:305 (-) Transcript_89218:193-1107(-)
MDDLRHERDAPNQDDVVRGLIFIIFVLCIILLAMCCRSCFLVPHCCHRAEEPPRAMQPQTAAPAHLQPKKRVLTGYALWWFLGLFGAHHFYLGRVYHGVLVVCSLNCLGFGWLVDMLMLPIYVASFNRAHTATGAPSDRSLRKLFCHIPLALLTLVGVGIVVFLGTPSFLHLSGLVDIDRIAAQTSANPYESLGVFRNASFSEAKQAYRKESLRWHPDRNVNCDNCCGAECEHKMAEITRAFDLIKRRSLRSSLTLREWLRDLSMDWVPLIETFAQQVREQQPDGQPSEGGRRDAGGARTGDEL